MADLWHPIRGIAITDLVEKRFLFKCFYEVDLNKKKKIILGDRTYYARFQYEKLSLFCFICGRLGHGESFFPVRVKVDLTQIVFGWDITLRAPTRWGPMESTVNCVSQMK
ncbi:hypothetical protein PVK06_040480 [Gossypium arboreum]|uniref:Zinc knuckle CX2CX4HX4C domain-containing protein n=1 Tax=Gossypium arboreum TaxID=29729 RepID=A0ABR0N5L8_GOSAR|nr:hypothetical protein PVK06_040480 [Gossypium arboreum]